MANMNGMIVNSQSETLKKKYLPRVRAGEFIACAGITEPNVGSATRSVETSIVPDGDDFVINGTKLWISNGQISDVIMVIGLTDKSKGAMGITTVVADREVSPYQTRELHKVGLRAWPTAEVSSVRFFLDYASVDDVDVGVWCWCADVEKWVLVETFADCAEFQEYACDKVCGRDTFLRVYNPTNGLPGWTADLYLALE